MEIVSRTIKEQLANEIAGMRNHGETPAEPEEMDSTVGIDQEYRRLFSSFDLDADGLLPRATLISKLGQCGILQADPRIRDDAWFTSATLLCGCLQVIPRMIVTKEKRQVLDLP